MLVFGISGDELPGSAATALVSNSSSGETYWKLN